MGLAVMPASSRGNVLILVLSQALMLSAIVLTMTLIATIGIGHSMRQTAPAV